MTIRWITPRLGTAPAMAIRELGGDVHVVDVRDLVDKAGNRADAVAEKIRAGTASLAAGKTTVVCCDYGISRSNAVAAGILSCAEGISLEAAVRRVQQATGETEIKVEPLRVVRAALGEQGQSRPAGSAVLLTGASGFVGSATAKALAREMRVLTPSREELDVARGSTQLDVLAGECGASAIVHLANPRVYTSNVALGTSLTMLRNVMDVCLARDIPLVYLSGWEIYSGYRGTLVADEALPPLPRGPYGEAKLLGEMLIEHGRKHLGLRCALVRSSPVYGPGADRPKFIYNFLDKARRGETIVTHHYRNGDPALDLLHIDDLVDLVVRVVRAGFTGTLNAGTGVLSSTYEIASALVARLGSSSRVERTEIDADTARIAMDHALARRLTGWEPTIAIAEGLATLSSQ